MDKAAIVQTIIGNNNFPKNQQATAFAPANIALAKYWGKREENLNIPVTNSLSISLGTKGSKTTIAINDKPQDEIYLNAQLVDNTSTFAQNIIDYLSLFRVPGLYFKVMTNSNIPIAAGVASSASGFAALATALNNLYAWQLASQELSILARLGSGSASRSLWHGFVEWEAGTRADGLDCFAKLLPYSWPQLRLGLLLYSTKAKSISSRQAMKATVNHCPFYSLWPSRVNAAITKIKSAIINQDFSSFGQTLETNALEMHALMLATYPPIIYSNADTMLGRQQVWAARNQGIEVYFTQDAGANLKLIFLQEQELLIQQLFPQLEIVNPWEEFCKKP